MAEPLLVLDQVAKAFPRPDGRGLALVLGGISLTIRHGQRLGLSGPSGAGKTTLARLVVGLERADAGEVRVAGLDPARLTRNERRRLAQVVQLIWQDPAAALNPCLTVGQLVTEPLLAQGLGDAAWRRERALGWLERVGVRPDLGRRRPAELSGGQLQLVALARGLVLQPRLLICDEILAGLDLPAQVRLLDLLGRLSHDQGLALLLISHDQDALDYLCPSQIGLREGSLQTTLDDLGRLGHGQADLGRFGPKGHDVGRA